MDDKAFVDKQVREIIQTWFSWETSPDRLMEARERLAKRILELRK